MPDCAQYTSAADDRPWRRTVGRAEDGGKAITAPIAARTAAKAASKGRMRPVSTMRGPAHAKSAPANQPAGGERPAGQQMEGAEEFRDGEGGGTCKDRGTEQIVAQSPVYPGMAGYSVINSSGFGSGSMVMSLNSSKRPALCICQATGPTLPAGGSLKSAPPRPSHRAAGRRPCERFRWPRRRGFRRGSRRGRRSGSWSPA